MYYVARSKKSRKYFKLNTNDLDYGTYYDEIKVITLEDIPTIFSKHELVNSIGGHFENHMPEDVEFVPINITIDLGDKTLPHPSMPKLCGKLKMGEETVSVNIVRRIDNEIKSLVGYINDPGHRHFKLYFDIMPEQLYDVEEIQKGYNHWVRESQLKETS